ncbi:hypothetical protein AB1Y20_000683 [Prymnesium parvum]|uniref:Elongation factor 1-beta n=1 Tax=Prymnesium parvum TaxID=97485 RepID=A0AB34K8Q3_PRYPA
MGAPMEMAALNAHMANHSYLEGFTPTQKDVSLFKAISAPPANFVHALRWYKHIASFSDSKLASLPGKFETLAAAASPAAAAASPAAAAPAEPAAKKEKAKEQKAPKEKAAPKEVKAEAPKEDEAAKAAKEAAKAQEKLLKAVIKEGGKKGVEIEGASDMGGLDFFCTTIDTPEGDCDLLLVAMDAMNADPDPEAEDRKGCSGHVGKMIFSAGTKQLAIVAYVPDSAHNKSAGNVDVQVWTETVCAAVNGKILKPAADAKSPKGGKVVVAVVASDPDNGKYAIKDKDAAMAAAFNFLREKGAFPEDNGDSDDEPVFGDDAFDDMNGW